MSSIKSILPVVGTVVGSYFGMPGIGGALGTALGGAAGGAIGTVLGGTAKPVSLDTPALPKQAVMPVPDSQATEAARRRSIVQQYGRKGRASTVLTQGGLDEGTKLGS